MAGAAIALAVAAIVAGGAPGARAGSDSALDRFDTVVLDAGHGGDDQGARGAHGVVEKELVLDVARRLRARLNAAGLQVLLTRERDVYVPLEDRTTIANEARGDLFISIHANAAPASAARGIETFFLSLEASDDAARQVAARENAAFRDLTVPAVAGDDPLVTILGDLAASELMLESDEFARLALHEVSALHGAPSRGVKQAPFVVLMGLEMPAALVEIGFVTNPADAKALAAGDQRERIAEALGRAVLEFGRRYDARRGNLVPAQEPASPERSAGGS
ncbi:MAG TPA: N-acetylmuramoyl-L-alanine amidase [Myxococcota bacterium]|nr:N-acetylmuramoyl-L-alanine amidase [Myxococcota bacterium]